MTSPGAAVDPSVVEAMLEVLANRPASGGSGSVTDNGATLTLGGSAVTDNGATLTLS